MPDASLVDMSLLTRADALSQSSGSHARGWSESKIQLVNALQHFSSSWIPLVLVVTMALVLSPRRNAGKMLAIGARDGNRSARRRVQNLQTVLAAANGVPGIAPHERALAGHLVRTERWPQFFCGLIAWGGPVVCPGSSRRCGRGAVACAAVASGSTGPRWCGLLLSDVVGVVAGRQVRAGSWMARCQAVVNAGDHGHDRSRWRVRRRAWEVRRAGRW